MTASLLSGSHTLAIGQQAVAADDATETTVSGARRRWRARQASAGQRTAGVLITVGCLLGSGWYVQDVTQADQVLITGAVASTGILNLNFAGPGVVARVLVHPGERVRPGQLLATQRMPGEGAIEAADKAAVAADQAELRSQAGAVGSLAAVRAQLARDQSRLASDRKVIAQSRIVAPAAAIVNAVDGEPGQTAQPAGIADYVGPGQSAPIGAPPLFSLLPDAPQVTARAGVGGSALLPVIQLRTSASWEVLALVPQSSAATVTAGEAVVVSVPAARLSGLRGVVRQILATPVSTADGEMYEAVVTITSRPAQPPLAGMTADVTLIRRRSP